MKADIDKDLEDGYAIQKKGGSIEMATRNVRA